MKIRLGSRCSPLALVQVDEILSLMKNKGIELAKNLTTFETQGDKDKITPLTQEPADNFFTDTLDQALLDNQIDIAIHSAKDLPQALNEGLSIFALTESLDNTDAFVGQVSFNQLKANAKVGTSSMLRQQSVLALNPKLQVVDIRGSINERIEFIKQGHCDGLIVATVALKRLKLDHLIKDIMPWETTPLQGQLAVVGRVSDIHLQELFLSIDVRSQYGQVTLVGAGPGDPKLITVKGIEALQEAEYVFYDYLVHKDLLDYAEKAEKINVGKRKGDHTLPQEELSKMLRDHALEGKNIVRMKGGDPLIFGRGADEISFLREYHIPVSVIPGVSSATAIPSGLGIPLTARGISSSVGFVSGHGEDHQKNSDEFIRIPDVDTIVFLMGLSKLETIIASLKRAKWNENTAIIIISKGTRIDEKIVSGTLDNIQEKVKKIDLQPPALIVVGETVKFWWSQSGRQKSIIYTGTNPEKYESLGHIIHLPMIEISGVHIGAKDFKQLLTDLEHYDMILFTSRFGVRYFFEMINQHAASLKILEAKTFIVIGLETALALREYSFEPALISPVTTSEGLLEAIIQKFDLQGKRILFPRSNLPNPYLERELNQRGCQVDVLTVYQNTKTNKKNLPSQGIGNILFTSPSTVENFLKDYGVIPKHWRILSKGPFTKKSLQKAGYQSEAYVHE